MTDPWHRGVSDWVRPKMSDQEWRKQVEQLPSDDLKLLAKLLMSDVLAQLERAQYIHTILGDREPRDTQGAPS